MFTPAHVHTFPGTALRVLVINYYSYGFKLSSTVRSNRAAASSGSAASRPDVLGGGGLLHVLVRVLGVVGGGERGELLVGQQRRREIADFVAANPEAEIAETPLRDWVLWDSNTSVARYADRMRTGSQWGGAIEMAVCARVRKVQTAFRQADKDKSGKVSYPEARAARARRRRARVV